MHIRIHTVQFIMSLQPFTVVTSWYGHYTASKYVVLSMEPVFGTGLDRLTSLSCLPLCTT